jgi:hypothetical protein
MSHRNLPAATRRPTPRLGTSPRPCSRCAHRWVSWRLPKSPLLPPRRAAWRLGQGVRRRTRRTTKTSATAESQAGNQGELGPGSASGEEVLGDTQLLDFEPSSPPKSCTARNRRSAEAWSFPPLICTRAGDARPTGLLLNPRVAHLELSPGHACFRDRQELRCERGR